MRLAIFWMAVCLTWTIALSQTKIPLESSASKISLENEIDSDSSDFSDSSEDSDESKPMTSGITRFFSSVIQIPVTVFKFVNSFISSAPLARLRDEMRSLNISYPKNN